MIQASMAVYMVIGKPRVYFMGVEYK